MNLWGLTLLQPWTAIVAAVVAFPVLFLLYFLKLRRTSFRVGSTLLWQQAVTDVQVNVPFRWIRFDWLLVLQALALACLVLAAGRPAINAGPGSSQRVLILIDRSASMSAIDRPAPEGQQSRSRLDEAKQRAVELIENLRHSGEGRAQVAVGTFASTATLSTPFDRDHELAADTVRAVLPTDQPADLAAVMELLATIPIGTSEDSADERVAVYIISDGGFQSPADPRQSPKVPSGIDLQFLRAGPDPSEIGRNVGIVSMAARRDVDDPGMLRLTLRLVASDSASRTVAIRIAINNQSLGTTTTTFSEETTITLPLSNREGGILSATILNSDALAADNSVSMLLDPAEPPKVLLVTPVGTAPNAFLVNFISVLTGQPAQSIDRATYDRQAATQNWGDIDLAIFDRVAPTRWPPVASLSFAADTTAIGLPFMPGANVNPTKPVEKSLITWKRDHPLLREVNLEPISLTNPRAFVLPRQAVSLAETADGPVLALINEESVRRVVCSFPIGASTWGSDVSFIVFMNNAMDYLTIRGQSQLGQWSTTNTPISVLLKPSAAESTLTLDVKGAEPQTRTRRFQVQMPVASDTPSRVCSFGLVERTGVYVFTNPASSTPGYSDNVGRVAVNLFDETETRIATRSTLAAVSSAGQTISAGKSPREVWDRFVLVGAILLTLEWLLYSWKMRG